MTYTRHAQTRAQQRCIPPVMIDWLLAFGAVKHTHGAEKYYFDKAAQKRLGRNIGKPIVKCVAKYLNAYVVMRDDTVITAGYLNRSIKNQ